MYAHAREEAGDVSGERALAAAIKADPATAAAARVKYDALRWYASKLAPKVYGDKLQHANAAGDARQQVSIIARYVTAARYSSHLTKRRHCRGRDHRQNQWC
jgi:hypothetical protein